MIDWLHRTLTIAVLLLLGLLVWAMQDNQDLKAAIAVKPRVDIRTVEVEKIRTVKVAGAVQIREKIIYQPGGERIVERIIDRAPVVTEAVKEQQAVVEAHQEPACPAPHGAPRYLAGLMFDPRAAEPWRGLAPRVGVTLGGRLDLAYSKMLSGPILDGHRVDAAWRFGGR